MIPILIVKEFHHMSKSFFAKALSASAIALFPLSALAEVELGSGEAPRLTFQGALDYQKIDGEGEDMVGPSIGSRIEYERTLSGPLSAFVAGGLTYSRLSVDKKADMGIRAEGTLQALQLGVAAGARASLSPRWSAGLALGYLRALKAEMDVEISAPGYSDSGTIKLKKMSVLQVEPQVAYRVSDTFSVGAHATFSLSGEMTAKSDETGTLGSVDFDTSSFGITGSWTI